MKYRTVLNLILFLTGTLFANISSAQLCTPGNRFTEENVFTDSELDSTMNVVYGNAPDYQNIPTDLFFDVFYPNQALDPMSHRPFVLLMHGGSFTGGNRTLVHRECKALARKGFVCASISYRLSNTGNIPARYNATQDANAAMRYFVDRADTLGIDTSWLFVGGESAGSIIGMNMVYISQIEWLAFDPSLIQNHGTLQSSGNTLTNSFDIKGAVNFWGSVHFAVIGANDMVPTISFHGAQDNLIPIDSASNGNLGSATIHSKLITEGVCSDLSVDLQGSHGIYQDPSGTEFRMSKVSCFLKSIACNTCATISTTDSVPANCALPTPIFRAKPDPQIQAYPNPMSHTLRIEGLEPGDEVLIFNALGQMVHHSIGQDRIQVDDFEAGFYLLEVRGLASKKVLKLFKEAR